MRYRFKIDIVEEGVHLVYHTSSRERDVTSMEELAGECENFVAEITSADRERISEKASQLKAPYHFFFLNEHGWPVALPLATSHNWFISVQVFDEDLESFV